MENQSGNILLAVLSGALVGAGIGILFAPDKGENIRQKIADGLGLSSDDIMDKLKSISEILLEKGTQKERSFEEIFNNADSIELSEKEALIELLEQKLVELKSQH